jgi:hypothetical protein
MTNTLYLLTDEQLAIRTIRNHSVHLNSFTTNSIIRVMVEGCFQTTQQRPSSNVRFLLLLSRLRECAIFDILSIASPPSSASSCLSGLPFRWCPTALSKVVQNLFYQRPIAVWLYFFPKKIFGHCQVISCFRIPGGFPQVFASSHQLRKVVLHDLVALVVYVAPKRAEPSVRQVVVW